MRRQRRGALGLALLAVGNGLIAAGQSSRVLAASSAVSAVGTAVLAVAWYRGEIDVDAVPGGRYVPTAMIVLGVVVLLAGLVLVAT